MSHNLCPHCKESSFTRRRQDEGDGRPVFLCQGCRSPKNPVVMAGYHIHKDGHQSWYDNGVFHREDGPAYISAEGSEWWFNRGILHRLDGPAFSSETHKEWHQNGKLRRLDGPAVIRVGGPQEWWVNHRDISEEVREWFEQLSIRPDWENWGDVEKTLFRLRF